MLQCASIQSPGGGEKDTNPPTVLRSIPKQAETKVKPSIIEIQFDEFLLVIRNLIFGEYRVYWTDRFTCCAINTFIRTDEQLSVARF